VKSAQLEGKSFTAMFESITIIGGTLKLLLHVIGRGRDTEMVNWAAVEYLIQDCGDRIGPLHSALSRLDCYEREEAVS